ncbi:MAG TPA: efflux RND transporter periplasmic adaptor subunit [Candidatus Melainabacteria bacterium]|nr:efflux RND transporter periplasmic adaptor subunit [Candidatus Melainabacteria bacterium]HIN64530.1 efflux RND transporter periplasmic adaptor subunit [Candidatus Obscuribacterales bacterium]
MAEQTIPKPTRETTSPQPMREGRKPTGFARLIGISGVIMSLALPIGMIPRIMQGQQLNESHKKIVEQLPQVSVTKVRPAPATTQLSLPGTIEAIVDTDIFARSSGYVQERFADIGDRVAAGQLLAKLQTPEVDASEQEAQAQVLTSIAAKAQSEADRDRARADLSAAIAQVSQARASLIEAESDQKFALSTYQRWKGLGNEGAVSWQDVDEKENRYKTTTAARQAALEKVTAAESNVVAARAKVKAESATVDLSSANVLASKARATKSSTEKSFQNVTSPFAGIITERNADTGMLVTAGSENSKTSLFKIARVDTVKVFIDVPQYVAVGIKNGQPVNVKLKEFPNREFTGTVARTSVALDPATRTLRTEIHIANKELLLAPGMYADVSISVPTTAQAYLIPANSLVSSSEGQRVLTLAADNTVHFKKIQLGHDLGTDIEVVGGLNGHESLVVNPQDTLTDGAKVATEAKK